MKPTIQLHLLLAAPLLASSFVTPPATQAFKSKAHLFSSAAPTNDAVDWSAEVKEVVDCASLAVGAFFESSVAAEDIVKLCDSYDEFRQQQASDSQLLVNQKLNLRSLAIETRRYKLLAKLMKNDYDAYIATASFLSPSRIPRLQLPNIQDVPMNLPGAAVENDAESQILVKTTATSENGIQLVSDCELETMEYNDNWLDKLLLSIFRKIVTDTTGGVTSDKPGILGLLDQGRTFMLQPGQTAEAQHTMLRNSLRTLMTPVLPPFYRIFMGGIVPKVGTEWDGKQLGPWFYAPFLTSFVTPTFFSFLVGPSHVNRRKDGELGGLVVEKCKFLQESGCKGLCLHLCKLPTQQFFQDELGLALTVSPNFATQECQWSFGETPLPPDEDPSFPKGCLVGCESRKAIAASGSNANICN